MLKYPQIYLIQAICSKISTYFNSLLKAMHDLHPSMTFCITHAICCRVKRGSAYECAHLMAWLCGIEFNFLHLVELNALSHDPVVIYVLLLVIKLLMAKSGLNSRNRSMPPPEGHNRQRLKKATGHCKAGGQQLVFVCRDQVRVQALVQLSFALAGDVVLVFQ